MKRTQLATCCPTVAAVAVTGLLLLSTADPTRAFQPFAFSSGTRSSSNGKIVITTNHHHPTLLPYQRQFDGSFRPTATLLHRYHSSRLYASGKNNEEESFLEKAVDKVKSIFPFSKSKSQLTRKEKAKDEFSNSIDTMLKDAPLGMKMFGQIMKPMVSGLVGGMAQAMEEQQEQMSEMLSDARNCIRQDSAAVQLLGGEPIELGSPFSQSSSTMSVNGESRTNLQASLEVRGSRASGVATITSANGRIENLSLNVGGRNIQVDTTGRGRRSSYSGDSNNMGQNPIINEDGIIDAEIVE